MTMGLKANSDGSGAVQVGGSDAITITSGLAATFPSNVSVTGNVSLTAATSTLGYGTGSGGTVTQLTSKSTTVTLNKSTGQITMNNAALAANTTAAFLFSNSLLGSSDVLVVSLANFNTNYNLWAQVGSGGATICLRNISAGSLSEAVTINFAVIKGVTS